MTDKRQISYYVLCNFDGLYHLQLESHHSIEVSRFVLKISEGASV